MTIEKIEKLEQYIKNALLGILALMVYFLLPKIEGIFFEIFNVNTTNLSMNIRIIYSIIFDILQMAIIILIFNKCLTKDFKENHQIYYKNYFKFYLIGLIIMMFSNVIINLISNGSTAGNQEAINDLFKISPLYVYFASVIFAPIVEELVFRKALHNIVPNKILFILISGLVFGGLHIIGTIETWYDLLYLIPYSSLGIVFAYILYKTDNIFVTMGLHFMHNGILIALEFFILLFG